MNKQIDQIVNEGINILNNFNREDARRFFILNINLYNTIRNRHPELHSEYTKIHLIERELMEYFKLCD